MAVHVRATYKAPNQADTPLKGDLSASFVVSDPRFQVNFVHPETIRSGEDYTAFAFITNTSPAAQTVRIDPGQIPVCASGSSWSNFNICFPGPMGIDIDFPAGLLYGKVLRGDNSAVGGAAVALSANGLRQRDTTLDGNLTHACRLPAGHLEEGLMR